MSKHVHPTSVNCWRCCCSCHYHRCREFLNTHYNSIQQKMPSELISPSGKFSLSWEAALERDNRKSSCFSEIKILRWRVCCYISDGFCCWWLMIDADNEESVPNFSRRPIWYLNWWLSSCCFWLYHVYMHYFLYVIVVYVILLLLFTCTWHCCSFTRVSYGVQYIVRLKWQWTSFPITYVYLWVAILCINIGDNSIHLT